jgi:hypothetical protein
VCSTTRSLRRNSPACGDDTPRGASWLWEGALPLSPIPPPCGSALWDPDLSGRKSWRYSPECVEEEFCEVHGSKQPIRHIAKHSTTA